MYLFEDKQEAMARDGMVVYGNIDFLRSQQVKSVLSRNIAKSAPGFSAEQHFRFY
jgi:hypothetical protein